jgi:uncharacterized protein
MSPITISDYLAALRENRLLGTHCPACGFITAPPRLACRRCGGFGGETVQLSGSGRIATFTAVHIASQHHQGQTPYLVVMVELLEGPWIMGNLKGVDPATANLDLIGLQVKMDNSLYGDVQPPDGIAPLFVLDTQTKSI